MKMKAFCCFSGGKESSFAYYKTMNTVEITYLLNMTSEDSLHSRSHGISSDLIRYQAQMIGVPIVQKSTSWQTYEAEFKKALIEFKKENIHTGIFGDIHLQGHREWIERVCKEVEILPLLPLWKQGSEKLINEFIEVGFKAIIVATNAAFLGEEWLGREINKEVIEELKMVKNIDLCGEKGEYHTFVYDGPIFKSGIPLIIKEKVLKDNHWFLKIELKNNG